jgi:tetratricopeptide (TPR) repeat protein
MAAMPTFLATLNLLLAFAAPAEAHNPPAPTAGEVSFPNSGAPEAQPAFLEGFALLHNFEYDDAATAFQKAQKIDPDFAMAYWGEAMTKNHPIWMEQNRDAARAILERLGPTSEARAVKAKTQREKDYLGTLELLYFGDKTHEKKEDRDFAYADAVAKLHAKYPDDPDAAAFHALALLGTAHEGRNVATYMRSAAILEELLPTHPRHPGVLHYLIHSYDDPVHAPLGLRAARVYAEVAPAAAHAQHMTSHIFLPLGMWDDVVSANETAVAVVNRARAARNQPAKLCGHYHFWLEYGYLQQGRYAEAKQLLEKCSAQAESETQDRSPGCHVDIDPDRSSVGSYVQMRARYLLDTEDWSGPIATHEPAIGDLVPPRVTADYMSGFAAVRHGDLDAARQALASLGKSRAALDAHLAKEEKTDPGYRRRAEVLERQLQALIRAAEKRGDEAVALLREAVELEKNIPTGFGPPFVDKPSGELLGELLLELGRPAEASAAFKASLEGTPRRTATLLGLSRAAARAGDAAEAEEARASLRQIWRRADRMPEELGQRAAAR